MIERQQHKVSNLLSWWNVYKEFSFGGGGGGWLTLTHLLPSLMGD